MAQSLTPQRGDLFRADLSVGTKIVLIVSWDKINLRLHEPIVCLVTANERERALPTYVAVDPPEGGLWKPSFILCHSLLTLEEALGSVSNATLHQVDEALRVALGLSVAEDQRG